MRMSIDRLKLWLGAVPAAVVASSVLALSACGDGGTAGGEEGPDVEDVQEDGEGDEEGDGDDENVELGSTVTVSSEVTEVLSNQSFRLEGTDDWENDPLLVVSARQADVAAGDVVEVTGTVEEFEYTTYSEDYSLAEEGDYEHFEEQRFIVADQVSQVASPSPGTE
ncbi:MULTISPECIES: hypothetical protein [Nocardiopsis]|uniref:DUF5666 domain-containing protein n=1 Tax=Nocardiopsis sinuspersici TaxID=501010 RepID=A0A1V3C5Q1_9ACTN|nr:MULTISPECIES: hypothetical protein [Nocardiopsis]OOC55978.1 hypothetical protein NOSIN_20835 [Nocardiopsis sinuspersici]